MNTEIPALKERLLTCLGTSFWFVLVYSFTNWFSSQRADVGVLFFGWEHYIPFVPLFIIPYWSIDLFFIAAPFFITQRNALRVFQRRVFWAVAVAGICFLLFPLELHQSRPEVGGILGILFYSIDSFDYAYNLAPSLHIALRTILWTVYLPGRRGWQELFLRLWFVCIGLSTLFVWQHHVFDVVTGQLLGMLVLHLVRDRNSVRQYAIRQQVTPRHLRLGLYYLGAALICLALCYLSWPLGFLLLWPITTLTVVAAAYVTNSPWLLGKCNGRMSGASCVLLYPYILCSRLFQRRYIANQPCGYELMPGVWFGRGLTSKEASGQGYSHILDLTAEYPEVEGFIERNYKNIPILDLTLPSLNQLLEAASFIEDNLQSGKVYIHCAIGCGRSALVAAAWVLFLKRADNTSIEDAIAMVRQHQPKAVFARDETLLLEQFKFSIYGKTTTR